MQRATSGWKVRFAMVPDEKTKLPWTVHLMCGWPLFLVAIGGAIGGALGGLAYGINMSLYKSSLPGFAKVLLNIVTGIGAVVLWFVIIATLQGKLKS
jgi:hypothetical protein